MTRRGTGYGLTAAPGTSPCGPRGNPTTNGISVIKLMKSVQRYGQIANMTIGETILGLILVGMMRAVTTGTSLCAVSNIVQVCYDNFYKNKIFFR